MGWEGSDRRAELPPDWGQRVAAVKKRDRGRCRWFLPISGTRCPRPGTDVDHRYSPHRHEIDDLWLLCEEHHKQKTAREARLGRSKRKPKHRAEERHPGLRSA